jgi:dTMP kinase
VRAGKYIVIEGSDGSGKTTQLERLKQRLVKQGIEVNGVREPAGNAVGRSIRKILADPQYEIDPRTEVLLFNAARAGLMLKVKETLEKGVWCAADRSFLSTLAYQCYGRENDFKIEDVQRVCDFAVSECKPDLMVVLDGPVEVFAERRKKLAMGDRIDQMGDEFFERVRHGYLAEAKRLKLPIIDGTQAIDIVEDEIWSHIEPLLKEA